MCVPLCDCLCTCLGTDNEIKPTEHDTIGEYYFVSYLTGFIPKCVDSILHVKFSSFKLACQLIFVVAKWQQFEARFDQLTSDKKDLLTQLQHCEKELKIKDECENVMLCDVSVTSCYNHFQYW